MWTVYRHVAPNGKMYIGITSRKPEKRWGTDGKGYKNHKFFWNAIQKYGWDNIKHEILYENLTKKEACDFEIELIAKYKTQDRKFGYNITAGGVVNKTSGFRGHHHTEEHKQYLREINRITHLGENNPMFGKHHKDESRKIMSEAAKNRTTETKIRNKVSNIYSRKFNTNNKNWQYDHRILLIEYKNIL